MAWFSPAAWKRKLFRLSQRDVRTRVTQANRDCRPRQQEDIETLRHRRCIRTSPGQCGRGTHQREERVTPRTVHHDCQEVSIKSREQELLTREAASHLRFAELSPSFSCPQKVVLRPLPCASRQHAAGSHSSCVQYGRSKSVSSERCPWSLDSCHRSVLGSVLQAFTLAFVILSLRVLVLTFRFLALAFYLCPS